MNELDTNGNKHGYWELELGETSSKGKFLSGLKHGVWRYYSEGKLYNVSQFNLGYEIYSKTWSNDYIRYMNQETITIHIEDYE